MTLIADEGAEFVDGVTPADIAAALESGRRLWVDVAGLADIETLSAVAGLFGMDALALEDITNTSQRAKVDTYASHALIVVHMFDGVSVRSKEQFAVLLDRDHVVTFRERQGDCLEPVRKRLQSPSGRIRQRGAAYLVYALLDTVLDAYFPMLERIGDELEALETVIGGDPRPEHATRLHELKRELLVVKRALWPSREMLSAMGRDELGLVPPDIGVFLRDAHDHAVQLIDIVETYRELAIGLLDLYQSTVSTKMNEVMKVLTIISTIFIPLSFLVGVWGMNFDSGASPWNMPELGMRYGYPIALGFMAAVVAGLLYLFRRKGWL